MHHLQLAAVLVAWCAAADHGPWHVQSIDTRAGARTARVFHSANCGRDWTVSETPVRAGDPSAGVFSIAWRDRNHGMIVGGDYRKPDESVATAAVTSDGGKSWTLTGSPLPYRSAVAWAGDRWVAVGPSGSDSTRDDGATWQPLDQHHNNCVAFTSTGAGWTGATYEALPRHRTSDQSVWYTAAMATAPDTSALDRVLDHLAGCFTPESAKRVADLRASPELQARMDELGDKCNKGELTVTERAEYETYVHAIDFISILQSKARRFLAKNATA